GFTCDSSAAGVNTDTLVNQYGCDSIVISTITFAKDNFIQFVSTSCDSADVGVYIDSLTNQYGCDSIVMHSITFSINDQTHLIISTCDPTEVNTTEDTLINQYGCDSIVTVQTVLYPLPELNVTSTSDFNGFNIRCND